MIRELYKTQGYLASYGGDIFVCALLLAFTFAYVSYTSYTSLLESIRANWNQHKCNPIYMPFAGIIMPQPGVSASDTTFQNFSYCINQDMSMVFSVVMIPFEFALYMVVDFLDAMLEGFMYVMQLIQWLKDQVGGIATLLYMKILQFIIPVIEITIHIRDSLAKINGVMVTALFTVLTIYHTTISGIVNIMTILNDLLITVIAIVVALIVAAFILLVTPAFPVGLTMYASANAVLVAIIIPTIVLYTLMYTFTKAVSDVGVPSPVKIPKMKKKKK